MTILFAGGEDADFTHLGGCFVSASAGTFRSAYARCALAVTPASVQDGWIATLSAPSSAFWVTARFYALNPNSYGAISDIFSLLDGQIRRLTLTPNINNGAFHYTLKKRAADGTSTTLATASGITSVSDGKLDVYVNYSTSGNVKVYLNGVLVINFTGDVTTDGATSLSDFVLGTPYELGYTYYWSEAIAATSDTRSLTLATLAPSANGNAFNWTSGSYADLSEITLSDATAATSAAANQIAEMTVTTNTVPATAAVVAVVVAARTQKGATGPANASFLVRTASTDYASSSISLPSGALSRISAVWETNPSTSAAWAPSDIAASGFNIGLKSLT